MDFSHQKILITGGSSGIGLATGCQLAALGADVWLLARHPDSLAIAETQVSAARRTPDQKVGTLIADVANENQVTEAINLWISQNGVPDLVINAAGIVEPGYFDAQGVDIFRQMMDVDFFGTLHVIKAIIPGMIARGSGHIVNISSAAGIVGWYGYSSYGSAKYAVRGLSEHLRTEMKPFGIKVSVVFPFDTQTPQLEYDDLHKPPETKVLSGLIGSPVKVDVVAKAIVKGISRSQFFILPGLDIEALYFLLRVFPGLMIRILDYLVGISLKRTSSTRHKLAHP